MRFLLWPTLAAFLFLGVSLLNAAPPGPDLRLDDLVFPPVEGDTTVKLRKAGEGTFHLEVAGAIDWTGPADYPVTVKLVRPALGPGYVDEPVASVILEDTPTFELVAVVAPGTYTLRTDPSPELLESMPSEVPERERMPYWGVIGPRLTVRPNGRMHVDHYDPAAAGKLLLVGVMQGLDPRSDEPLADPPVLRWDPVDGASHYGLRWFSLDAVTGKAVATEQNLVTTDTEYPFPVELTPGNTYQWDVEAYKDHPNRGLLAPIARSGGWFSAAGGEPSEDYEFQGPPWPTQRTAVLGVRIEPARSPAMVELWGGEETDVRVDAVFPDSPAALAGFFAEDRIVSVDRVPVEGLAHLQTLLGERQPGDVVRVEVEREERRLVLRPKLMAPPKSD